MKKYLTNTFLYRWYKRLRARRALWKWGNPSAQMIVIGVTGTDGKTTTSRLIHHLIHTCLGKAVFVGTTGVLIGDTPMAGVTKMTSYDPTQLQRILAKARDAGCTYAVLEVSSHGLEQKRFDGIRFHGAALTNITPEHLDYHHTIEHYARAKQKLFQLVQKTTPQEGFAVFPADDERGRRWYEEMTFDTKLSYGRDAHASLYATDIDQQSENTNFLLHDTTGAYHIQTHLVGKFNVANIMAARGIGRSLGIDVEQMIKAIGSFQRVSGRQEHLLIEGVHRYVDYAHTPHGLEVTLEFLQTIKKSGRVICVFGAPGKRDRGKRPLMGQAVERVADVIIVTDDDPDTEDRRQIIDDIRQGITRAEGDNYRIIPNRRDAITFVAQLARPDDVVLLAGIGHQDVLFTNYGVVPWSEKEIIEEAVKDKKIKRARDLEPGKEVRA